MPALRTIAQAAVVCLVPLTARVAVAQQIADSANRCVPQKGKLHPAQPAPVVMFATLVPAGDTANAPAIYLATLLQEVGHAFTPPDTIARLSDGAMSVWLHRNGRLTNPQIADTLLPVEVARALVLAMDSVSRAGGIGPVVPDLRTDSVDLRLVVHYADQRTPLSVPLLRVALPPVYFEFQVEKPAIAIPGNPAPKYPLYLRESNISGDVLTQFVIDERGRPDMRTFKVLETSHGDFVLAIRAVLPRMRFHPAEIAGCKVKQLVQFPFAFRLGPPPIPLP